MTMRKMDLLKAETEKEMLDMFDEKYRVVHTNSVGIFELPIVSYSFLYCRGLILRNTDGLGVAHAYPDMPPDSYIDELLEKLPGEGKELFLVSSDIEYPYSIDQVCVKKGIAVVGRHLEKEKNIINQHLWILLSLI